MIESAGGAAAGDDDDATTGGDVNGTRANEDLASSEEISGEVGGAGLLEATADGWKIGDGAFAGSGLKSIDLGEGKVTDIGSGAFSECASLNDVSLGQVEKIGDYAFSGASNLNEINIPASVKSIGKGSFNTTSNLVVNIEGTGENLTDVSSEAFDTSKTTVKVSKAWTGSDTIGGVTVEKESEDDGGKNEDGDDDDGLSGGAIAGIVIACVVVVVVVVVIIILVAKGKICKKKDSEGFSSVGA